jgi:alpha-galactosidase
VTTDCGWTVPNRTANGTLTWNATLFPDGFPAMGEFIHSLGLGFGVYSDSGIQMCMVGLPNQTGSLYHEQTDADTFSAWGADLLKYDNCYSSKAHGYPDADYDPVVPVAPRYKTMRDALNVTGREILYQICEWGVDFPSAWAPPLGNTWRITNDIIPAWRTIWRQLNQFVPSAPVAGPGHWPDLDMLEVGNDVFAEAEEQTHFSLWAIAKSPLVIGGALNDTLTTMQKSSLDILSNTVVIGYNQDSIGKAATLARRYTEAGLDVWSGPLSGERTIAALINWNNESVTATLNLPDVGLQSAGEAFDVWNNKTVQNVLTSCTAEIAPHGTLLLELRNTTRANVYMAERGGTLHSGGISFSSVSGVADGEYLLKVQTTTNDTHAEITITTSASNESITTNFLGSSAFAKIVLLAGNNNTITLNTSASVASIELWPPLDRFYPATSFNVSGTAQHVNCTAGLCQPIGAKIGDITQNGLASITIPRTSSAPGGTRYVGIIYINNDVALSTSWTTGTNSRNITVAVNGAAPVRLEVPLSGKSSELFSPMLGWGDPATLWVNVDGFGSGNGTDTIVVSNVNGDAGVQPYGADFVGLRVV